MLLLLWSTHFRRLACLSRLHRMGTSFCLPPALARRTRRLKTSASATTHPTLSAKPKPASAAEPVASCAAQPIASSAAESKPATAPAQPSSEPDPACSA